MLYLVLAFITVERLGELLYAARNTRALKARGAVEAAPEQYPFFIVLHAAWIVAMLVLIPRDAPLHPWVFGAFLITQAARVWTLRALGEYWTTRIISLPGAPLVKRGPYRFMRHPNYAVVVLEIALLPLSFGAYAIALAFTVANAALLLWRIRVESRLLDARR